MKKVTTYRAKILNPISYTELEYIDDGALVVDDGSGKGTIIECTKFADARKKSGNNFVNLRDKIIMPGLIDTHTHLPQYDYVAEDGLDFQEWMESCVYPAEERFESVEIAKDASARFFHDLKANGTTTACVYNTIHQEATDKAFEQAEISGLRILMGKVMMDQNSPASLTEKTNESLHTSEELCSTWHNKDDGRLNYVFTPRFAPACSRQLMKEVSKLASKHGAYIQTHLAENRQELELVQTLFPECKNYAQVYEDAGLLGPKSIMAHCIHLDDIEISLLKNRRAKVAHCPSSNLFLKSGIFNMRKFMDGAQIDIGLGSDVAGGPSLSIFQEMANACYVSKINDFSTEGRVRAIDPVYAFYLATLGGAKVLSQDSKIGSLSPGKEADFIVLDTEQIDPLKKEQHNANRNPREILSQLVYRWPLTKVESTFIRGSKVYCNENEND